MIKELISKLIDRHNLTSEEMELAMNEIMSGNTTPAQIAAFLVALRMKGETIDEITSAAHVMRDKAIKIDIGNKTMVDTCGTGGDSMDTFNISTISALVAAGAGITVAKHGNRAVSSRCGSADLMEALGVKIDTHPSIVEKCLKEIGFGFLFAPIFHPAMKYAIGPRREVGIRTIFNILGPLSNPANATAQVLGVFRKDLTEPLAYVLKNLGVKRAFVVYGQDGMDEITTTDSTKVSELKDRKVVTYDITPEEFNLKRANLSDLEGKDVETNVKITLEILQGKKCPGREIACLNAAAALVVGDIAKDFREGIKIAEESIDSGNALRKLELLKEYTQVK
ncbi:MAG: anthranilate phosphoribosyltransferase [Candidatus Stahlbacteria bacterium]|nr:anthranilate phosphoribosyltransferase [Candidatus Stahlbacteria bacterium]